MNIEDLELFVRTIEAGSISAAAQQMDLTPAAASAGLKRLERQLGTPLMVRSTRRLRLTEAGERFLVHCREALAALDAGRSAISAVQGKVAGRLRLSVSSDLGRNLVLPWLEEAMDQHPELALHLDVGDALSDFYADRIDVALRYGEPPDSSMVAFKVTDVERLVCASPAYIRQHGVPDDPDALRQHNCLLYRMGERIYNQWTFHGPDGRPVTVQVRGDRESNDADIVRRWAVMGRGIVFKSVLDLAPDLIAGRLTRLLRDYPAPRGSLWLVCPGRRQVTPAVIFLRELLREKCAALIASLH
ncbi:MAG: LysR family transcriptional regulator [Gammaproteobacteria bacterium]|nr:MAG: LysR family transcriptional regulator [Gammaproteobacteria bacterium]